MKRFLCFALCLLILIALPACTIETPPKKENNNAQTQTQASSLPQKEDKTFGINETAVFKELKFTATEIQQSNGTEFFTPAEGKVFVAVKFTVENISNEEQTVSSLLLFEGYVDDIKCDYSFNAACAFNDGTLDGSIAPGKKLVGWYAIEVPADWKTIELHVQSTWLSNNSAKFVFKK